MNDRDFNKVLDAFLELGPSTAPDRVGAAARREARETRQTVLPAWWPSWRFPIMNTPIRATLGIAAVAVLAIAAYSLLPRNGNVGGDPSPTPSPSPTAEATSTPPPGVPPAGALSIGRHPFTLDGVPLTLAIPSEGWSSNGQFAIMKGDESGPESAGFIFWVVSAPDNVFADPCDQTPLDPPAGQTPADLAEAITGIPNTDVVVEPEAVTVGGQAAQHVAIMIRDDIPCAPASFHLWYDTSQEDQRRYATSQLSTIHSWIVDVDGTIVWIDAETYDGPAPAAEAEIMEIIDSIEFDL